MRDVMGIRASPMLDGLHDLGVSVQNSFAGFCGGVAYVFVAKTLSPSQAIGCVIVGTFTGNYFAEVIAHYISFLGVGGAGFLAGLGAMAICQGAIEGLKRFRFPMNMPRD